MTFLSRRDELRTGVAFTYVATTAIIFFANWVGMALATEVNWDEAFAIAGQYTLTIAGPAFLGCYAIYRYAVARL